jgi:branched-chain amino acid transport system ATP-binding protein
VLVVQNLEVVYHQVILVLRGVSLTVPARGVVCLLGPNGAGKTTLMRAVTGLLRFHEGHVTKGEITFDGVSLANARPEDIVRLGISQVMEGRRVFGELTVEENLLAGAYTASRRDIRTNLDRFYQRFPILAERRHRPAGYLSGGEQQMLAIARALMNKPRLLVLDEPSLGLAPQIVADVANLIREIVADGVSVLLVEQNASMALSLSQTGYILETGRVVREGPSAELLADDDVREFYLGLGHGDGKSYRDVKHYRRRRRWLS